MKCVIFLTIFLVGIFSVFGLNINEIMYNPEGDDNNREFIEIFNPENLNLSNFIISDAVSYDTLTEVKHFNSNYSLIVESGFNHSKINASIYSAGATIGNNLNILDNLTLFYPNKSIVDILKYSNKWGADGDGYSLEKLSPETTNIQENWRVSLIKNGTSGKINSVYGTETADFSKIKISEFIPDPRGNDSSPMPDGEWIELYNPTNTEMNLKWFFMKDLFGHILYVIDTTVTDGIMTIPANGFLVVYTNGKSGFLNNLGVETLSLYNRDGTLIQNVTYYDSKEGNSYAYIEGIGWQNTMPTPGEKNVYLAEHNESFVNIENVYDLGSDKKAKFGQTIRVKVNIYKGDTAKNTVKLWIEDNEKVSKETTTNIYTKYTSYVLTLPIQIKPNCNGEFDDGTYYINIEGFGKSDKQSIKIEDNQDDVCDITEVVAEDDSKFEYNFLSYPETIYPGYEFITYVEIKGDDKSHELEVWSYVYKGSTSYSGDKEMNKQKVGLSKGSTVLVSLLNTVDAKPGDYKLKVKIKKDDLKTLKELTGDVKVENYPDELIYDSFVSPETISSTSQYLKPFAISTVMFESSQKKAEHLVPYFMAALMTLSTSFLIFSKV